VFLDPGRGMGAALESAATADHDQPPQVRPGASASASSRPYSRREWVTTADGPTAGQLTVTVTLPVTVPW
jgi:hypothetical protein